MDKMKNVMLAMYRKSRLDELQNFINKSDFQAVMHKAISFLTDGAGDEIRLRITTGKTSYTDGKSITLGMEDYFFDPQFTTLDWVTIFKALLAHEVQHINSSNFSDIMDIRNKYSKMMQKTGLPEELTANIAQDMLNIMEDGRIENIIVHKYPGYKLPFLLLNQSFIDLTVFDKQAETPGDEFVDFVNTCSCYTLTGRLPEGISVYAGTRFEREFKNVQPLFDVAVDARTSKKCKEVCLKMLELTADYFADLLKEQLDQQKAQQRHNNNDGRESEYTSNGEREYNDSPNGTPQEQAEAEAEAGKDKKPGKGTKAEKGGKGKKSGKDGKDGKDSKDGETSKGGKASKDGKSGQDGEGSEQSEGSSSKNPAQNLTGKNSLRMPRDPNRRSDTEDWTDDFSGDGAEDYETRKLTDEEKVALRRGVSDELEAASEESVKKKDRDERKRGQDLDKIRQKYAKERIRSFSELYPTIPTGPLPTELERIARKLENSFERVLRIKRTEKRNMRVGNISGRDLYRAGMNDPHIFMRKGQPMKADLTVFLLLDNSGSMSSQGAEMEVNGKVIRLDKATLARTAAGIIERSLAKFAAIKISLFDVSGSVIRHSTIKKFDEKTVGSKCYNSIEPLGTGGGNKDGYSIRVATQDLLGRRESKKVLVILADGLPSDYDGGDRAGMNDVKDAVREARRKGVIVIPIMFGRASDREHMKDKFEFMYGKFISCDPNDIYSEFQKLFLKLINQV